MPAFWTILIISWLIIIFFPQIIAYMIWWLLLFFWLNILLAKYFMQKKSWNWENYVKFWKYKIYKD